jgi:hypothetical protein
LFLIALKITHNSILLQRFVGRPAFTWVVLSIDTSDPSQECLQVLFRLYLLMLADFVQGIERFKKAAAEVKDVVLGAQVGIFHREPSLVSSSFRL